MSHPLLPFTISILHKFYLCKVQLPKHMELL